MQLIFATNNAHKVSEIQRAIPAGFEVLSLKAAGIHVDIPEPRETLEENASEKSGVILQLTLQNCFSEDTGLEVDALQGAPGVRSARYAGDDANATQNVAKLLATMQHQTNRAARFRTVISLRFNGQEHLFEGICNGHIATEIKGSEGFGYDPVFVPDGDTRCFAEMNMTEKNAYSHRAKAVAKLFAFLATQNG
ncbi:MAG TPA: RdgB/HAM1 family non-canonical purine NTP pyrophosphatase [Phnomibacter sp.]|nr:RdgB/HAM1 family non-canonical purine NTP pyrophosphatase [Phnomibacter sp.]